MEVLRLLARRESRGEEPPSVRDVARAAGYASSKSGQRRLEALERAGLVARGEAPSRKRRPLRLTERGWEAVGEIPALGRIAAGPGMEAVRVEEASAVARELFGAGRFLLEAAGQSMTGAGIEDGDQLLIVADPSPPDGTIVAALIGGERVTVKRLFREGENVRLRAENGEHKDIVAPAEDVEVQGRVELILRRPWRR
ncbi:MAG: transcriptional repressor LexA [Rubrobacteraceae bacterium]